MSPTFDAKAPLTEESIVKAAELEVDDIDGKKVKFGTLFESEKAVVVFIRHFFCGLCQIYVENLARVPSEPLSKAQTRIIVIGCGEYEAIKAYHDITGFKGAIYADPTRDLYHALGMTLETLSTAPSNQPKPGYLAGVGMVSNIFTSIWKGPMKNPVLIGKQGNISQLGGEFIFGPGKQCLFASRMRNTEDHVSVEELMQVAGVEYKEDSGSH
ncbi:hypothetical protein EST38_g10918 [Candolleomyces aberdarensis]|uniref:Thioredoxin domain-containing protein n=1 Tax=Candolleomyces aberdarensis TaxID=2316362 RepID=A0A4Q2D679_9AGAR|nr:hypothetical protein EST38_g10918 [Candolleomyces aberdarensis]